VSFHESTMEIQQSTSQSLFVFSLSSSPSLIYSALFSFLTKLTVKYVSFVCLQLTAHQITRKGRSKQLAQTPQPPSPPPLQPLSPAHFTTLETTHLDNTILLGNLSRPSLSQCKLTFKSFCYHHFILFSSLLSGEPFSRFETPPSTSTRSSGKNKGSTSLASSVHAESPSSPQEQALIKHLDFTESDLDDSLLSTVSPPPAKAAKKQEAPKRGAKEETVSTATSKPMTAAIPRTPRTPDFESSPLSAQPTPASPSLSPKWAPGKKGAQVDKKGKQEAAAPAVKPTTAKGKAGATAKPQGKASHTTSKRRKTEESVAGVDSDESEDEDEDANFNDESFRYDPFEEEEEDEDADEDDSEANMTSVALTPVSELKHPYGRKPTATGSNVTGDVGDDEPTNEASRPKRTRVKPLAYWNGEKIEYKIDRRASGSLQLPTIKNVIRPSPSRYQGGRQPSQKAKKPKPATSLAAKGFKEVELPQIPAINSETQLEELMSMDFFFSFFLISVLFLICFFFCFCF